MDPTHFLTNLSLPQYIAAFLANDIDASLLPKLTDGDLVALGVDSLGHRKRILVALADLGATSGPPARASSRGNRLPTLLALPLVEFEGESSPLLALWAACDLAEITLKLCVMCGVAEHPTLPAALMGELRNRVELPTLGKWLGMALAVVRHAPRASAWPHVRMVHELTALMGGREATVESGLLALRNRLAHGGPVSKAEAARLHGLWAPRVQAWVETSLGWLEETRLVAVDDNGQAVLLLGPEGTPAPPDCPIPASAQAGAVWLFVGDHALALGPLGTFDPERRALQIYVRRGELTLQFLRMGEEGGLCDSDRGAVEAFCRLFRPDTPEASDRRFVVRGFESEVASESARRIGRERELQSVLELIRSMAAGILWITGPAGIGKSNLVAAVAESLALDPPAGALVLPYRFRAGDDRCNRQAFLDYLRERILASEAQAADDKRHDTIASTPAVRELITRLRPDHRLLLVLDGLDEIAERDTRFVEDVLLRLCGERVTVVAAGRPEFGLPQTFRRVGAVEPFPDGLPPMREDDVRSLLLERTGPVRKRLLARDRETAGIVHNTFIERVAQRSEGLPIYVNHVIGDLNSGRLNPEQSDALPASLHAYHDELLRRASIGDLQAVTTSVLVLLALAHEALTVETIAALLTVRRVLATPETSLVEAALLRIGAMIQGGPTPEGEAGVSLFHHSLRTHVRQSPHVDQTVRATRAALADAAKSPPEGAAHRYLYRSGIRHLLEAERAIEAADLLVDPAYVAAACPVVGALALAECLRQVAVHSEVDPNRKILTRLVGRAILQDRQFLADFPIAVHQVVYNRCVWHDEPAGVRHYLPEPTAMTPAPPWVDEQHPVADQMVSWRRWLGTQRMFWIRSARPPVERADSAALAVLRGHRNAVDTVAVSPDGRLIASGDTGATLVVWDANTGEAVRTIDARGNGFVGLAFIDDHRVMGADAAGMLRVWDATTGELLSTRTAPGHWDWMAADGTTVVAGRRDGAVLVWESDASEPRVLKEHEKEVFAVAVHHAAGLVASGGVDEVVRVHSLADARPLWARHFHDTAVITLAFSPDASRLAVASAGRGMAVVDARTGSPLWASDDEEVESFRGLTFTPDGRHLIAGRTDGALHIVRAAEGKLVSRLVGHHRYVRGVAVQRDGHRIASGAEDGDVRLWDLTEASPCAVQPEHSGRVRSLAFTPDGRFVVSASADGPNPVHVWSATDGTLIRAMSYGNVTLDDQKFDASGSRVAFIEDRGAAVVWNLNTSHPPRRFVPATYGVTRFLINADGSRILLFSRQGDAELWDVDAEDCVARFPIPNAMLATFDPSGHLGLFSDIRG